MHFATAHSTAGDTDDRCRGNSPNSRRGVARNFFFLGGGIKLFNSRSDIPHKEFTWRTDFGVYIPNYPYTARRYGPEFPPVIRTLSLPVRHSHHHRNHHYYCITTTRVLNSLVIVSLYLQLKQLRYIYLRMKCLCNIMDLLLFYVIYVFCLLMSVFMCIVWCFQSCHIYLIEVFI